MQKARQLFPGELADLSEPFRKTLGWVKVALLD